MTSSREVTFPAVLSELHNMLAMVKQAAEKLGFSQEKLLKVELACEELLVNIISYAYPGIQSPGVISITCSTDAKSLKIQIKDHGVSFNPLSLEIDLQKDVPIEEKKIGGLGIFLAKSSVDEFHYARIDHANVVTLVCLA